MQGKDKRGRFLSKSSNHRQVRSIRATDETWYKFGEQAAQQGITRADLLEKIATQELTGDRVIHGKISEVVVILQHGITSKSQGGVYRSNSPNLLKQEVVRAIAILEELTGLEDVESYVASDLQPDSDSNDTRQYTHSEVAEIVKAGRSTVGKYHEKFRGGEPTGKSPVAKRIKDEGFRPSTTKAHRWVKVK